MEKIHKQIQDGQQAISRMNDLQEKFKKLFDSKDSTISEYADVVSNLLASEE